jgi:hypothetical protein
MGAELVTVRVRDCACPDTPHEDGDVVYLLPTLSLEGGAAAEMERQVITDGFSEVTDAEKTRLTMRMLARLTDVYVRYGAVGWNWLQLDAKGKPEPVPFDVEVLLRSYALAKAVAGEASELYSEDVLGPLLAAAAEAAKPNRQQRRSRTGRTTGSTSARRASTSKPPASSSEPGSGGPALRIAR